MTPLIPGAGSPANPNALTPYLPLLAYVTFAFLVAIAAYYSYWQIEGVLEREKLQDLGIIAETKVEQISAWRKTQSQMGAAFSRGSLLTEEFDQWLQDGMPSNGRQHRIQKLLDELRFTNEYKSVVLLDRQGVIRASASGDRELGAAEMRLAAQAMETGVAVFSDFHRNSYGDKKASIDLAVPLAITGEQADRVVGAAVLQIDPGVFLYPLIQSWPTRLGSAEVLLVRREGDDVVFLNELRHNSNPALSLRIPLVSPNLPAAMAIQGKTSAINGVDYRGVPVVAAMREVPGTHWFMVAKVDKDELFETVNQLKKWTAYLGLVFTLLGGGLIFVWLNGIQARSNQLKVQRDMALEREMLIKHFEYLTKYASDNIMVADSSGRILEANERTQEASGYTREELLRMNLSDLRSPTEDIAVFNRQLEQLNALGELRYETIHQRKDGTTFPVEVSIRVIEAQGVKYLHSIGRDITERKRAEQELRQQKNFTLQIIDSVPSLIFVTDAEGKLLLVNQFMANLHDLKPEELVGQIDAELLMNKEQAAQHLEMDRKVLETRRQVDFITHNFIGDRESWLHFTKVPMVQPDGAVQVLSIGADITERKQAEQILRQQKNFTLQIIDTVPNLIFVTDVAGKFLLANKAMAALHGMKPEALIGQVVAELFLIREHAEKHLMMDQEVLEKHCQVQFATHHFLDGKSRWFHFIKVPMEQPDGTAHVLSIGVDITERKQFEETRADIENTGRFNIAGEMASGLAHELSQPLTACNNYLVGCMHRMDDDNWDREKLMKAVQLAQKQAERAGTIIKHLKNMVRKQGHEHTLVDVNLLAKDVMNLLEDEIKREGISTRLVLLPLPQIMACKVEIEQVLLNLYKNAIEAMHACPQRELCVTTRVTENGDILISVSDTGDGISSDEMKNLFSPFQTTKQDGLGLGLVICRSFVENHGGRIWANPQRKSGAEFCFTLSTGINHG